MEKTIETISNLKIVENFSNSSTSPECETAEDALTTDSDDYLSEPLRYRNFSYSTLSPNATIVSDNLAITQENNNYYSCNDNFSFTNIQIPIVGYEIMEERARFTVYKLRIENKTTGDCWYVFRRYTDFVRLCNRFRNTHPQIARLLPCKRWLKNNFDPIFLQERINGLQLLVNAILAESTLISAQDIQDFFCFNEPPIFSETNEESKAIFEALEETINDLKHQLRDKEIIIDNLQEKLHTKTLENESLIKLIRNSILNCQKCEKECDNFAKLYK